LGDPRQSGAPLGTSPVHGPNGGADILDEAKAAFRAGWGAPLDGAPGREPASVRFLDKKRTRYPYDSAEK
jgi:hypothetical protein